jgi:Domain of unknown function (DUF6265)
MNACPSYQALWIVLLAAACGTPEAHTPVAPPKEPTSVLPASDPLASYRQLTGSWMDHTTSDRFQCYERWEAQGDTLLTGFGYAMAKGDTVFIEDLKLEVVNGQVTYSARVDSQNNGTWVPFSAQPSGPDTLMFENPGHDFPQCITYVKDSAGAWDVAVTGNEAGTEREERFHFTRR